MFDIDLLSQFPADGLHRGLLPGPSRDIWRQGKLPVTACGPILAYNNELKRLEQPNAYFLCQEEIFSGCRGEMG